MAYETAYDAGLSPFNHDKTRGKWSSSTDFLFACIGHAFKIDSIVVLPSILLREIGIYGFALYMIILGTCAVPIVFMQSFLGQFSSTGFISVFRISPVFKGIGFVSLAVNVVSLMYYSIYAAVPLFYFFHSLRPTLPWSCEGAKSWFETVENITSPCQKNRSHSDQPILMEVPSVEFFRYELNHINPRERDVEFDGTFSWSMLICNILIWAMIAGILTRNMDLISKYIRYSSLTVVGILSLLILRLAFLPNAFAEFRFLFVPSLYDVANAIAGVPLLSLSALGTGWGSIITMASFNNFKTDIYKSSWVLCLAQLAMVVGLALISMFASSFLRSSDTHWIYFDHMKVEWMELLVLPSVLTEIELSHIWCLLFCVMLMVGPLNVLVVQLFSVLTSLFDEYEQLRSLKREVTLGLVVVLGLVSIYLCSNDGLHFFNTVALYSIATQALLNLLLLLVVLWIYGRERFQRDLHFMTNRTYPTWMVNIVRFVAPLFLLLVLLTGVVLATQETIEIHSWFKVTVILILTVLPWSLVPGYCIFKVMQTTGMLRVRWKRCIRPMDWYPADPLDRQRYEEAFSNTEITHQLTTDVE